MSDFQVTTGSLRRVAGSSITGAADGVAAAAAATDAAAPHIETGRHFEGLNEHLQRATQGIAAMLREFAGSADRFAGRVNQIADSYDANESTQADAARHFFGKE